MNKLIIWSSSVALAGLLFGFDTAVISGADKALQDLWQSTPTFHGVVVMGMALWGTVIGAIFGGIPTNKFGRKNTLIAVGILFFVSALGSALANDPAIFAIFRFIGGLGVGASTIAAPAYITEIAPAQKRGRLVAMYQLSIVLGILIAFISNYFLRNVGDQAWRWMLGVECIPAVIYGIIVLFVPKSPRWLVLKGRTDEARKVMKTLRPDADIDSFVVEVSSESSSKKTSIFIKKYRPALALAFFIAFFNQLSGINAFLYFGPRIFAEAGLGESSALLSSAGIGLVNIIFTVAGMFLIDRYGRKHLMYIGSIGYIISLTMVALSFFMGWGGLAVPIFLFVFIAAHAIGQGTVIWVFIAELFPTHLRASGQAFGSSVHWILAAIISSFFPVLVSKLGTGTVFAFFAIMMVIQLVWVHFKMPETKGVSLEKLSENISGK
jgi:MFS transporter, SP family, arabinose:H+ symporter